MAKASEGKGRLQMWKDASAIRKWAAFVGVAASALTGAAAIVSGSGETAAVVPPAVLESRVTKIEQDFDVLRARQDTADVRQDSTVARVGRIDAKLDRMSCWLQALYDGNRSGCVGERK